MKAHSEIKAEPQGSELSIELQNLRNSNSNVKAEPQDSGPEIMVLDEDKLLAEFNQKYGKQGETLNG